MPPVQRLDAMRASPNFAAHQEHTDDEAELSEFEAELKRLSAANQELMDHFQFPAEDALADGDSAPDHADAGGDELGELRRENAALLARLEKLEATPLCQDEETWLERQREYEVLLEEKSEVIRSLHLKMQEIEESALGNPAPVCNPGTSATRLGQAEEILRLKRELETQRRQLEQDEEEMMAQMRQMELAMAKERAEMARQRQEVTRLQSDLAREIENSSRNPELRERLNTLRRQGDSKQTPVPLPIAGAGTSKDQKSSGFLRRIFG